MRHGLELGHDGTGSGSRLYTPRGVHIVSERVCGHDRRPPNEPSPMPHWSSLIRDIPDFPKPGIVFRDITPVLADARGFADAIDAMVRKTLAPVYGYE